MGPTEGGVGLQPEAGSGETPRGFGRFWTPRGRRERHSRAEHLPTVQNRSLSANAGAGCHGRWAWFLSCMLRVPLLAFKHFGCDSFPFNFA